MARKAETVKQDQFAQRLCEMWLAQGRPQGREALNFWKRAYVLIIAEIEQGYGRADRMWRHYSNGPSQKGSGTQLA